MKSRANIVFSFLSLAAATAVGAPSIDSITVDASRPKLVVDYMLGGGEAAVVTAEVRVNGEAIAPERFVSVSGDVGHVVEPGPRRFTWNARKDWPEQKLTGVTVALTAWATNAAPDYLVVDLTATNRSARETVTYYVSEADIPYGVTSDLYKTERLVMRKIPAAGVRWAMGSPEGETGRVRDDEIQHFVTLTSDYYMGVYPVTVGQYRLVRGAVNANAEALKDPVPADADCHPVSAVAYGYKEEPVQHWLRNSSFWPTNQAHSGRALYADGFLGQLQKLSGIEFDLPTSAQWEFACRAGSTTAIYGNLTADEVAWYSGNTNRTVAVGLKRQNAWGLYDMLGNVYEWCIDIYVNKKASDAEVVDPAGPTMEEAGYPQNGIYFARRGSAYTGSANDIRCAGVWGRQYSGSDQMLGFRVCCPAGATW